MTPQEKQSTPPFIDRKKLMVFSVSKRALRIGKCQSLENQ